jgi:hypothetical protein
MPQAAVIAKFTDKYYKLMPPDISDDQIPTWGVVIMQKDGDVIGTISFRTGS